MRRIRKHFLWVAGSLFAVTLTAQTTFNSPFSMMGLGDISGNLFPRNSAMGGLSVATRHPWYIDMTNPASYTARDSLSLVFDFGLNARYNQFENATEKDNTLDFNFQHFAFGFPVARKVGMAFGIAPYSESAYVLSDDVTEGDPGYNPNIGDLTYLYRGEGGIHRFFIGTGIQLFHDLSVGVNLNYLFGNMKRIHTVSFLDNTNAFNTKIEDRIIVSDISFDAGLQYHHQWKEAHSYTLGLVAGNGKNIRYSNEHLESGVYVSSSGSSYSDTIMFSQQYNDKMYIPLYYGAGATFDFGEKWRGGLEYVQQNWSKANIPFSVDSLTTSRVVRAGVEFVPDPRALRGYWKKIQYRAGMHYGNSYILVNKQPVTDFGMSFGLGLPVLGLNIQGIRKWSFFSITFGTGWRGSVDKNFMKEQYNFIHFGLSFNDIWFIKRKYL